MAADERQESGARPEERTQYRVQGRTWLFPEPDINTDQIMPGHTFVLPEKERYKFVLASVRPGWSAQVRANDIIVGGRNFGVGSGRPCGKLLRALGIVAVVAESINGLFLRNCVNSGLVALSCPGVTSLFRDGDVAEVLPLAGEVRNVATGASCTGQKLPASLLELAAAGGVIELLLKDGSVSFD
jgi:3-isopropylmalate/(R)-2-methylmalate dehydratase small subunit